jgi:hypothetical protein
MGRTEFSMMGGRWMHCRMCNTLSYSLNRLSRFKVGCNFSARSPLIQTGSKNKDSGASDALNHTGFRLDYIGNAIP